MILLLDLVLFRQVDEEITPDDDRDEGDEESGRVLKVAWTLGWCESRPERRTSRGEWHEVGV
jgi:hypothetical protein